MPPDGINRLCMCGDGRDATAELDEYEGADLDEKDYADMSPNARAEVERRLKKRDRDQARRSGRLPSALTGEADSDEEGPARVRPHPLRCAPCPFCRSLI
jgi:hypothetical protein